MEHELQETKAGYVSTPAFMTQTVHKEKWIEIVYNIWLPFPYSNSQTKFQPILSLVAEMFSFWVYMANEQGECSEASHVTKHLGWFQIEK